MTEEEIKKFNSIPDAICDYCGGIYCSKFEEMRGYRPKCLVQIWDKMNHQLQMWTLDKRLQIIVQEDLREISSGALKRFYRIHPDDLRVVMSTDTLNLIREHEPERICEFGDRDKSYRFNWEKYFSYCGIRVLIYDEIRTGFCYICERLDWRE